MPTESRRLGLTWLSEAWHAGGTGGLNWHLHARRAQPRWKATVQVLAAHLDGINPQRHHLLLIGASAGWMMPPAFLQRFERIDAYDIDPLAGLWFRARHAKHLRAHGVALRYHRFDAIAHLSDLLAQHTQACVWFDNLLGQLRYRFGDTDAAQERLHRLHHDLRTHPWGSVHDAYSGRVQQNPPPITPALTLAFERTDTGVLHAARPFAQSAWAQHLLALVGAEGEWLDHLTADVLPVHTPGQMIPWAFKPHHWHWLQAGWVTNAS
ncbi:MAG: hypothetical protein EBR42_04300 [Betaproteobacteria bacterium]|nr:hypothetical protein [Betaproteobacteria bacterium]